MNILMISVKKKKKRHLSLKEKTSVAPSLLMGVLLVTNFAFSKDIL